MDQMETKLEQSAGNQLNDCKELISPSISENNTENIEVSSETKNNETDNMEIKEDFTTNCDSDISNKINNQTSSTLELMPDNHSFANMDVATVSNNINNTLNQPLIMESSAINEISSNESNQDYNNIENNDNVIQTNSEVVTEEIIITDNAEIEDRTDKQQDSSFSNEIKTDETTELFFIGNLLNILILDNKKSILL